MVFILDGTPGQDAYNHRDFPRFGTDAFEELIFNGFEGSDWVLGGFSSDRLNGSNGTTRDQIDQLTGWAGGDFFVLNNFYGLQNNQGFAVIWDYTRGLDTIEVFGGPGDYFFVQDFSTWLDDPSFLGRGTGFIENTILARRDPALGAVMVAAFSDIALGLGDLTFTAPLPF